MIGYKIDLTPLLRHVRYAIDAARGRIVNGDYLEYKSTILPSITPKYRHTLRVWDLANFTEVAKFDTGVCLSNACAECMCPAEAPWASGAAPEPLLSRAVSPAGTACSCIHARPRLCACA